MTVEDDGGRPLVWLLEDSPLHARVLRESLADLYRVEHFSDGAALLEALAGGGAPAVLVLDWELPGLAGIEVCRFVREGHDELALPILMHTGARNDPPGLLAALAAGVNDFVPKPCAPAEIRARIKTLLRAGQLYARSQRAERERAEALAALAREAVVRERFVGILGHDLRSPLSAILMSAALQRKELADPTSPAARPLAVIERSGRRMERMIADLLDLARSRSDEGMPIVRADVDLAALCRRVLDEAAASDPGRAVELAAAEQRGLWDADRVEQAVGNLVANALAYGRPDAPVTLALRGDADVVTLDVVNAGEIAGDALAGIFDPFRRGAEAAARPARGGLGLGLYIVHSIVAAHGGAVTALSADGVTTFRLTLPRRPPPGSLSV